jgi:hypothetical protein
MKNLYKISYYKYAPESFRGYIRKADGWHQYQLSPADTTDCGIKATSGGYDAGLARFKHIVRQQARPRVRRITYGFVDLDDPGQVVYCRELFVSDDDLHGKLQLLKQIKSAFSSGVRLGGKATLGAAGKIEKTEDYIARVDISKPIKIYLA